MSKEAKLLTSLLFLNMNLERICSNLQRYNKNKDLLINYYTQFLNLNLLFSYQSIRNSKFSYIASHYRHMYMSDKDSMVVNSNSFSSHARIILIGIWKCFFQYHEYTFLMLLAMDCNLYCLTHQQKMCILIYWRGSLVCSITLVCLFGLFLNMLFTYSNTCNCFEEYHIFLKRQQIYYKH